jgi:hypothetical protein
MPFSNRRESNIEHDDFQSLPFRLMQVNARQEICSLPVTLMRPPYRATATAGSGPMPYRLIPLDLGSINSSRSNSDLVIAFD